MLVQSKNDENLIALGKGSYFLLDSLLHRPIPTTQSIVDEIEKFRKKEKIEKGRLVIIVDKDAVKANQEVRDKLRELRESYVLFPSCLLPVP